MTSISLIGSTFPSTWIIFGSSKQRTTSHIASTSRICERNWFPNPSPLLAPFTSPAISVNENDVGTILLGLTISTILSNLSSFTSTTPTFGSIVANGKFAAKAPAFVIALNNVDFPTLGSPTIPAVNPISHLYYFFIL